MDDNKMVSDIMTAKNLNLNLTNVSTSRQKTELKIKY